MFSIVKLDKQKNFRMRAVESAWVEKAAGEARLTESDWLRLVVLAALGKTALVEQLLRSAQLGDRLRERIADLEQHEKSPRRKKRPRARIP